MSWIWKKIDMLIGAICATAAAMAASQTQAFLQQYLQRLGGHLDEARLYLDNVQTGVRYQVMSDAVRRELETEAQARVSELQTAFDAISNAGVFARPFVFLREFDDGILTGTMNSFVPALPLESSALVYVIVGMVLALVIYEIIKLPFVAIFHQPRKRRFKKRGTVG